MEAVNQRKLYRDAWPWGSQPYSTFILPPIPTPMRRTSTEYDSQSQAVSIKPRATLHALVGFLSIFVADIICADR
jgi:hypothetical protein